MKAGISMRSGIYIICLGKNCDAKWHQNRIQFNYAPKEDLTLQPGGNYRAA